MAVLSKLKKTQLAAVLASILLVALACTLLGVLLYPSKTTDPPGTTNPPGTTDPRETTDPPGTTNPPTKLSDDQKKLLCQLRSAAPIRTVDGSEEPFSSLGWSSLVPSVPLQRLVRGNRTCAVVSSAGALLRSGLGREIDSHAEVMRFNHAPTAGYEEDVGGRTTFRLVNEQIPSNPRFEFRDSPLYRNVTLVTWEKARGDLTNLSSWYTSGKVFAPYVERRETDPDQPFYLLHPVYVWQLWQVIQNHTTEAIQTNPPTSGFQGILVMMQLCDEVDVYEYIPSDRQTALCKYFEPHEDISCTVGGASSWHPIRFEKQLIRRLNTGSEADLRRGRVTLPGYSAVHCDQ